MRIPPSLRRILERLSRGVTLKRNLPERFGSVPMIVSPEAALGYWKAFGGDAWDDLFEFAEDHVRGGSVVWDVGANLGVFAICAAVRAGGAGSVLAFEPDAWSAGILRRSIELNRGRLDHLRVLQVAVADKLSIEELHIPQRGRAAAHLKIAGGAEAETVGGIRDSHLVPTVPLDWVAERMAPPDVLKIDVDGAEWMVLKGASALLSARRPVLLVEVFERNADNVTRFLADCGYALFDMDAPKSTRSCIPRAVYNTLAMPKQSLSRNS